MYVQDELHNLRKKALERWNEVLAQRKEILEAFIAKYGKDPANICQIEQRLEDGVTIKYWVTDRTPTSIELERDELREVLDTMLAQTPWKNMDQRTLDAARSVLAKYPRRS